MYSVCVRKYTLHISIPFKVILSLDRSLLYNQNRCRKYFLTHHSKLSTISQKNKITQSTMFPQLTSSFFLFLRRNIRLFGHCLTVSRYRKFRYGTKTCYCVHVCYINVCTSVCKKGGMESKRTKMKWNNGQSNWLVTFLTTISNGLIFSIIDSLVALHTHTQWIWWCRRIILICYSPQNQKINRRNLDNTFIDFFLTMSRLIFMPLAMFDR